MITNPWLWLDLETTGLDPKEDRILALGFILTDSNLNEHARAEFVLGMDNRIAHALNAATQIVRDMHTKSGLLKRMDSSDLGLYDAVFALHQRLDALLGAETQATLAGSTVHFDRGFIYEHAPSLLRHVGHRHLDVSALKVLASAWGVEPYPKSSAENRQHTPLSDLDHSIAEFRHWRQHMLRREIMPEAVRNETPPPCL